MEKEFSLYLRKIGIIDENVSIPVSRPGGQSDPQKIFINTSFYFLMNYFEKLTKQQKKYMSFYIPMKYKLNKEEKINNKLKSIFIHIKLRERLILLKHFLVWKRNISLIGTPLKANYFSCINKKINEKNLRKESSKKNNSYININKHNCGRNIKTRYKNIHNENNLSVSNEFYKGEYIIENIDKINQISQDSFILDDYLEKPNKIKTINEINYDIKREYLPNKNKKKSSNTIINNSYDSKGKKKMINKIKNNNNEKIIKNINFKNYIKNADNALVHKNNTFYRSFNKKNHIYTSLEEKEMKELEECTFQPKINKSHSYKKMQKEQKFATIANNDVKTIFDKLYLDNEKYKFNKELRTVHYEHALGKTISFTPYNNNFRKSHTKSDKNFQERQNHYLFQKNINYEILRNKLDSDFENLCSFSPKITNYRKNFFQTKKDKNYCSLPVYQRLYDDVKERKIMQEKKENENIQKFYDMSNLNYSQKKNVDYDALKKLNENNKEDIINKIKEKINIDKIFTFNPKIEQNDYLKNVSGTFLERNQKFIEDMKNYYEEENKKLIERLKSNSLHKDYTKEERTNIINNIINKLYKKQNEIENENDKNNDNSNN